MSPRVISVGGRETGFKPVGHQGNNTRGLFPGARVVTYSKSCLQLPALLSSKERSPGKVSQRCYFALVPSGLLTECPSQFESWHSVMSSWIKDLFCPLSFCVIGRETSFPISWGPERGALHRRNRPGEQRHRQAGLGKARSQQKTHQ